MTITELLKNTTIEIELESSIEFNISNDTEKKTISIAEYEMNLNEAKKVSNIFSLFVEILNEKEKKQENS
jgi:hypothetical protein